MTLPKLTLALAATAAALCLTIPRSGGEIFDDTPVELGTRLSDPDQTSEAPRLDILTPGIDPRDLPLQSSTAEVNIAGVIADVQITQIYHNTGDDPIEAKYVFPGSTRAAVHGMRMQIGERVVEAQIKEKNQARRIYNDARSRGQTASLLSQHRPNVFEMNVANIKPGDKVEIVLDYTEHLVPVGKVYEFVYPTSVVERFSEAGGNEGWEANPYVRDDNDFADGSGSDSLQEFDIAVDLNAGLPIDQVRCISHEIKTEYKDKSHATIRLKPGQKKSANRDYILQYRLAGKEIASGLLLYEDQELGENFFLLTVQPPKRTRAKDIPPREYIFVVDISGSMSGFPLQTSKQLLRKMLTRMRPVDRFNVILFAGSDSVLADKSLPANEESIEHAFNVIDKQRGGGGTRMLGPLKKALEMESDDGVSRNIILVTDGHIMFEKEAFETVRASLGEANLFAFGIGANVNRHLIEGVARTGCGEPFIVTAPDHAGEVAGKFWKYISAPVLTDIEIDYGGLDVYDVEPKSVPDVIADRPVVVFGKYHGKPDVDRDGEIKITGRSGKRKIEMELPLDEALAEAGTNPALPYLWARSRIATLGDFRKITRGEEVEAEITNLGLTYNLLTDYTSFVAVMPAQLANQQRNKTPKATAAPEPGSSMLLLVGLSTILLRRKK